MSCNTGFSGLLPAACGEPLNIGLPGRNCAPNYGRNCSAPKPSQLPPPPCQWNPDSYGRVRTQTASLDNFKWVPADQWSLLVAPDKQTCCNNNN